MITQKEFEDLGFKVNSDRTSPYYGGYIDFYKIIDNGHVIAGHDTTEVFVTRDGHLVIIHISRESSYQCTHKELAFKGRCNDIDFFIKILDAVRSW